MKRFPIFLCALSVTLICGQQVHAQGFLKKLKDKVNQVTGNNQTQQSNSSNSNTTNSNGSPTNKTGGGLSNTPPPNVSQNIDAAEKSGQDSNFSQARYSLQQAILGVEIELGKQLLQSLPAMADGLTKDTTKGVVMSTQYGWGNLTIQAVYSDGKDKQMTITIGNNTMYAGIVNMYFNNAVYTQGNNANNQNIQQVQVKGQRALIQFDKSKGYTLMMQLGQSTLIVWEDVNFATEDEVLNTANSFDIDGIKKMMGEQ